MLQSWIQVDCISSSGSSQVLVPVFLYNTETAHALKLSISITTFYRIIVTTFTVSIPACIDFTENIHLNNFMNIIIYFIIIYDYRNIVYGKFLFRNTIFK